MNYEIAGAVDSMTAPIETKQLKGFTMKQIITEEESVTNESTITPTGAVIPTTTNTQGKIMNNPTTTEIEAVPNNKSSYALNNEWMKEVVTPNEIKIREIKEASRTALVKYNTQYFDCNVETAEIIVGKLLDESKLVSDGIALQKLNGEIDSIKNLLLKGTKHIVLDVIEPLKGNAILSHTHYFDAKYTTKLRGKETYKVGFNLSSIKSIIVDLQGQNISITHLLKALVKYIGSTVFTEANIYSIAEQLISSRIIENTDEFVLNALEAQTYKGKIIPKNIEEEQAFEIMKDYAMLNNQGKAQIINTTKLGLVSSSESGLKTLFKNQLIGGVNPVDIWIQSKNRPLFIDTKFDPSCSSNDEAYNLFKGFAYPAQKFIDIAMFKNFVKDVICSGDDEMYNIVWSFLAQMMQDPSRKMGTALVLLSSKGTGKSTFVKVIGELLKGYFFQSADNKRLLGEFNNHLASTLLFYANELTFTDNKRVISKLKNVITEKNFTYEIKGGATYGADNFVRVIIDSNDDMAVVQTADERRFIYPVISEAKIGDTNYFNELHDLFEMEGFYESLMYDLMNYDYAPWEHYLKTPPKNEVTEEQVLESFTTVESWWLNCLETGVIPYAEYEVTYDYKLHIANEELYKSFAKHTRANGERVNIDALSFAKAMKKHILQDIDLDITNKIRVNGIRKNSRVYETREKSMKHYTDIKKLNNIDFDGKDWEESIS